MQTAVAWKEFALASQRYQPTEKPVEIGHDDCKAKPDLRQRNVAVIVSLSQCGAVAVHVVVSQCLERWEVRDLAH